jgi:hypothetical protein
VADTTTKVQGPIEIKDNSKERVALDLLMFIQHEDTARQDELLELYARCLTTAQTPYLGLEAIKKRAKGQSS